MKSPETLQMDERIKKFIFESKESSPKGINSLMQYQLYDCSFEEKTLDCIFPVEEWMLNPSGAMHGGLICTAIDITFGTLSIFLTDNGSPTVKLDVSFVRPIKMGDIVLVKAKCINNGKTLSHLTGEALSMKTGRVCATSIGIFFNV